MSVSMSGRIESRLPSWSYTRSMPSTEATSDSSSAARYATSASRHFPFCSSSMARMGIPGCACARTGIGASANPHATASSDANAALRLLRIDALEVIEHEAPLLRRQPAEVVPVGCGKPRSRLAVRRRVRRQEQLFARRRLGLALPGVVTLVALERAAGVEHATEQPLLSIDHVRIERAGLQRLRELPRFLCKLLGPPGAILVAHVVERRRDFALLPSDLARLLATLLVELSARPRNQLGGLRVQRPLLLGHVLELLEHLGEPGGGARVLRPLAIAH